MKLLKARFKMVLLKTEKCYPVKSREGNERRGEEASFSFVPSCVRPRNFSLAWHLVRNNHVKAVERFSELMAKNQCF